MLKLPDRAEVPREAALRCLGGGSFALGGGNPEAPGVKMGALAGRVDVVVCGRGMELELVMVPPLNGKV